MIEIYQVNIFDLPKSLEDAICITTNGIIKKNGRAVMGAGIAKEAVYRYTDIDLVLALCLRNNGNHVYKLGVYDNNYYVLSFPTKHHWKDDSSLELIEQSCNELKLVCDQLGIKNCYIPTPGCSNGHLNYESQVKPILERILTDDRFIVVR